ncbi:MAG TPA: ComF family protein [Sphingobacteriaceae bacterium]|nr:ComF family protein [Sphingobacteriaceae bacterium]
MILWQYISDFISLFFPEVCLGCRRSLLYQEEYICTHCAYSLPYTEFHLEKDNVAAKKFWGRVPLEAVASYLYFTQASHVQQVLHFIKYRNKPKAAQFLGRLYGIELAESEPFKDATLIIPVPLHKSRLRERGYNQSDYFAKGLSESMGIEMHTDILKRTHFKGSQTKKSRYQRYENTTGIFKVNSSQIIENQHVLLVDDVLTTGATLEACAEALLQVEGVRVSVVTLVNAK